MLRLKKKSKAKIILNYYYFLYLFSTSTSCSDSETETFIHIFIVCEQNGYNWDNIVILKVVPRKVWLESHVTNKKKKLHSIIIPAVRSM